jgi:hypothetical protein
MTARRFTALTKQETLGPIRIGPHSPYDGQVTGPVDRQRRLLFRRLDRDVPHRGTGRSQRRPGMGRGRTTEENVICVHTYVRPWLPGLRRWEWQ